MWCGRCVARTCWCSASFTKKGFGDITVKEEGILATISRLQSYIVIVNSTPVPQPAGSPAIPTAGTLSLDHKAKQRCYMHPAVVSIYIQNAWSPMCVSSIGGVRDLTHESQCVSKLFVSGFPYFFRTVRSRWRWDDVAIVVHVV